MLPLDDKWEDITRNSDVTRIANCELFESLVGSTSCFWKCAGEALGLLQPVAAALRFIEGDYARISYVYLLMGCLFKDVSQWSPSELSNSEDLKRKAKVTFQERWTGVRTSEAGRHLNIVPLQHPVHIVSFYLDPYVSHLSDSFQVPVQLEQHAESIFRPYCESDAECREVRQEFMNFVAGTGEYRIRKRRAINDAKAAYAELEEKYFKEHNINEMPSRTQRAVLDCTAAASANVITWWINNCRHAKLKEIAVRILSCSPTSAVVERMNSMHKLIQTKTRAALKHERVIQLLYCYVNMRLVAEVDQELLDMVEEALIDEIEREDAEQQERARLAAAGGSAPAAAAAAAACRGRGTGPAGPAGPRPAGPGPGPGRASAPGGRAWRVLRHGGRRTSR